ncbi:TPA: bifunctional DnaQ family exonuclease/ATP-dependent helicase [Streptococcus suis]
MTEKKTANRYAVVDLEATGSSLSAKIIQIGIVIVENGQIVEEFSSDINPYEKLDHHIKELTGITDRQLAKAPDFSQVAGQIYDLIGEAIFVAHNVKFDANLLAEALFFEGYDLLTPRVDTVELAQLFFPTFEKYGLATLADQLGLQLEQAHTAIADAKATAELLIKIQEKIKSLPKQTVEQILSLADNLLYESRLVIDEVYADLSTWLPEGLEEIHGLVLKKPTTPKPARQLSKEFEKNLALLGLEEREIQGQFAGLVEERLRDDAQVHFIQAQAGIGKTYGYLLPLLAQTDQPILVTVPTKILQQQIADQEGRKLEEIFHISLTSVKSASHYLKLDRYWATLQRVDENRLLNRFKMQILVWLCQTETGDLDELRQKQRYQAYFDEIQHDGKLSEDSLFADWDFWRRLQEKAATSRILLTNHAYLLTHLKDQDSLMKGRIVVIDEAQKLLLAAEELASQTINLAQTLQVIQSKKDRAETVLTFRLYESSAFELNELVNQFRTSGQREVASQQLEQLRQNLKELDDWDFLELDRTLSYYSHFWLEEHMLADKRVVYLRASKEELLDVARLLPSVKTFCISATLHISKKVSLADLLGFEEVTYDAVEAKPLLNQSVLLPTDLPSVLDWSREDHARFILKELQILERKKQPVLVLFTSIALLLAVSDLLDEVGMEHLAQHKHGAEDSLKRRFERGEASLLLGTGLFWEGVDFASQPEMIAVLTRLPFENPRDRFVVKVNQRLRQEGKHPFYDYSLPMMMMKLKQAIGRTNRSENQRSAVVILDNRLQTKRYGKQVIDFLAKDYPVKEIELAGLSKQIDYFFDK